MSRYPSIFQRGIRTFLILAILAMFLGVDTVHAATITVDTLIDENDHSCSDGDCSLRDAVESSSAGDVINFSVSGIITLSGTHLLIDNDLSIIGPGPNYLTISGNDSSTIFTIAENVEVAISGLTLTDGNYLFGGAISSSGELTIDNCVLSGNQSDFGGAIHSWILATTTTINNCMISGNNTDFRGGGVYNRGDELIINNTTISDNQSIYLGGGVFNEWGTVTVVNSTISGNTVNTGGGIANVEGTVTVTSSTISGNTANAGGGIHNSNGTVEIIQSTITNNTANSNGGGVYTRDTFSAVISLKNTIIAGNFDNDGTGAEDCYINGGTIISLNYNLLGSGTGCNILLGSNDQTTSDANLRPLADYGGDTETHALYLGSPAMDKIPDGVNDCGTVITADQRGVSRPQSGFCDIGAFEYPQQTFSDVLPAYWAYSYIEAIADAGLTSGYPDGTYRPENPVTRAEMAVFLLNGMGVSVPAIDGSHPFSDIAGHWAESYIEELFDQGITGGYPDGTYRPENLVTRAEMAVFLLKGISINPPGIDGSHPFSDIAGHWAEIFIEELFDQGITGGYPDGTYRPENRVTRAEMAVFLVNTFGIALP